MNQVRLITDKEERWHAWIALESYRRLVFLILMRDIQLCSFFQNLPTRALSIFTVRVGVPTDEASWQARSAPEWSAIERREEPTLPQLLKFVLTGVAEDDSLNTSMNLYSELTMLHGLTSIGWDLRWRGGLRASAVETIAKSKGWRPSLQNFYSLQRQRVSQQSGLECHLLLDVNILADLETRLDLFVPLPS